MQQPDAAGTMGEYSGREPCPARICDDIGGAFAMGAVGGGIWHSVKVSPCNTPPPLLPP